ncbi:hypothetical protein [Burkholderia sp. MSMB1072]|uniref:hypothetical protein n=1 Tax=Burkholderia sp. MSMB1072 TaxID=1637871 RepID=UPI000AC9C16F|nr:MULTISPECIES: hypothetical protein [unclassified Burkholderia]
MRKYDTAASPVRRAAPPFAAAQYALGLLRRASPFGLVRSSAANGTWDFAPGRIRHASLSDKLTSVPARIYSDENAHRIRQ